MLDGAEIDPHMAMRALERRSPEDWARRERVELSNSNDKPMEVDDLRRLVIQRLTGISPPTEAAALPAAAADPAQRADFVNSLPAAALLPFLYDWSGIWARDSQLLP